MHTVWTADWEIYGLKPNPQEDTHFTDDAWYHWDIKANPEVSPLFLGVQLETSTVFLEY